LIASIRGSANPAPHQDEPRIDAINGAKGCSRVILDLADVHIHALFRRERQSFLRIGEPTSQMR
jgi:hypothetical protein